MKYPILTVGSRGPAVVHLKKLLAAKGLHKDSDDDRVYAATADIIKLYQTTHLGPTGKFLIETEPPGTVTENTWKALEGAFDQRQHAPTPALPSNPGKSPRKQFIAQLLKWYKQGVREIPKGSNSDNGGPIDAMEKFHGMSGQPWCAMTINYAHHRVFGTLPPWGKCARVCVLWNEAVQRGLTKGPYDVLYPGDLGVYISKPLRANNTAPDANGHIFTITGTGKHTVLGLDGNSDDRIRASERSRDYLSGVIRLWAPESFTINDLGEYEKGAVSDR